LILDHYMNYPVKELFKIWHFLFEKHYSIASEEANLKFKIFQENVKIVKEHNSDRLNTYSLFLNSYADHSLSEFKDKYLSNPQKVFKALKLMTGSGMEIKRISKYLRSDAEENYQKIDWVGKNQEEYVYNQGRCGSCWAFAITQSLEWEYFIKNHESIKLSKQQLVDCDSKSSGCEGGFFHTSLAYIKENGLELEQDYKYEGVTNKCKHDKSKKNVLIKRFDICMEGDCQNDYTLYKTLENGPVAVVVDASEKFMLYSHGVYDQPCKEMNHAVLLVGYEVLDKESGVWKIKNSWGKYWGDHGYIKIKRQKDYNSCLVSTYYAKPFLD